MYTIPYYAVAAELTEDYDERTKIRGMSSFINAFCIGVGNIMPALVGVGAITYMHVAGGLSILAVLAGFVCAASLKGVYQVKAAKDGERRESIITAFPQLVQKFGSATGILLQGVILGAYGYDTTSESGADAATFIRPSDHIVSGMENVSSIIPAVIVGISLLFLLLYPVTRKTYNALTEQLKKKRAGEKYGTQGIEKLLK